MVECQPVASKVSSQEDSQLSDWELSIARAIHHHHELVTLYSRIKGIQCPKEPSALLSFRLSGPAV